MRDKLAFMFLGQQVQSPVSTALSVGWNII